MMITSTANPKIKFLRSLHLAKFRQDSGSFLAEGLRLVGQSFDSNANIQQIIYAPEILISDYGKFLVEMARKKNIEALEVSSSVFESIARKDKPQGIAALVSQNWQDPDAILEKKPNKKSLWLAIEAIQNPGNLGTVLRTCDATGVDGIILLTPHTDPYDPASVKASMGAIFTVPMFSISYAHLVLNTSVNGFTVIGTSDKASCSAFSYAFPENTLILIGSEREGLSQELVKICDQMISIPMVGACDSLNLSVATGIILYEVFKQHNVEGIA